MVTYIALFPADAFYAGTVAVNRRTKEMATCVMAKAKSVMMRFTSKYDEIYFKIILGYHRPEIKYVIKKRYNFSHIRIFNYYSAVILSITIRA